MKKLQLNNEQKEKLYNLNNTIKSLQALVAWGLEDDITRIIKENDLTLPTDISFNNDALEKHLGFIEELLWLSSGEYAELLKTQKTFEFGE